VDKPQQEFAAPGFEHKQPQLTRPGGYLTPVAYLWTRTVRCKRLDCEATVPLVRQTWLCKKAGRFVALQVSPGADNRPRFTRVQSAHRSEQQAIQAFGFDPGKFSKGGNAACISCGTVADSEYVKQEGRAAWTLASGCLSRR